VGRARPCQRVSDPYSTIEVVDGGRELGADAVCGKQLLESVYEARDEIRQLVRVLEIRREGATDEGDRRELLRRMSVLRDERLRDDHGAFATLAELVPLEPEDASVRERFVEIGRRLAERRFGREYATRLV